MAPTSPIPTRRRGLITLVAVLLAVSFQFPLATATGQVEPAVAAATVIHVATTGDDASDGTTVETAVATIRHAVAIAPAGATILVAAGTYHETNIHLTRSVTLLGDPGDAAPGPGPNAPVIDGDGTAGTYPYDGFVIDDGVHGVTISGFEIRDLYSLGDNDGTGVAVQAYEEATWDVTVADDWFHDVGYGVLVGNDSDYGLGTHHGWSVVRNVVEGFVVGIELTDTSDSTAGDNVLHMTDGTSGDVTHHAATALWSYVRTAQSGLVFSGNTIDGALDPDFSAWAFPEGGYPAILVWVRDDDTAATLTDLSITHNDIDVTGVAPRIALLDSPNAHILSATIGENRFGSGPAISTDPDGVVTNGIAVAATLDASDDWWGQGTGPAAGQAIGNLATAPWMTAYDLGDPARTPGFWPETAGLAAPIVTGAVAEEYTDPSGLHVDVAFDDVTTGGTLALEPVASVPTPTGFRLGDPAIAFDLVAGGGLAFQQHVVVCVAVDPYPSSLRLYHHGVGDVWEDVTLDAADPDARVGFVCGRVTSFSEFVLGDPATVTTTTITADDPDPSAFGAPVTVAVRVDADPEITSGTIGVSDGTGANCTITLVDASTGSCQLTPLAAGPTTITASFSSGDADAIAASEDTEAHVVIAPTTVIYTGDTYLTGDPTTGTLRASVTSPDPACMDGRTVEFWWDVNGDGVVDEPDGSAPDDVLWATGTTGTDGTATETTAGIVAGIYELIVRVPAVTDTCGVALNTGTLVVAGAGDSSNGGGWYTNYGRVSFGYTVQVKTNRRTGAVTVGGQLVWNVNGQYRVKGAVSTYTSACTADMLAGMPLGARCGYLAGTGSLYTWSDGTGWILVGPAGFRVTVWDGGSATVCSAGKKKTLGTCTSVVRPDYFGMVVPTATLAQEGAPTQLKGGNLIVR